jgi:hypothetical protein
LRRVRRVAQAVIVSASHRYRAKFVTLILYKPARLRGGGGQQQQQRQQQQHTHLSARCAIRAARSATRRAARPPRAHAARNARSRDAARRRRLASPSRRCGRRCRLARGCSGGELDVLGRVSSRARCRPACAAARGPGRRRGGRVCRLGAHAASAFADANRRRLTARVRLVVLSTLSPDLGYRCQPFAISRAQSGAARGRAARGRTFCRLGSGAYSAPSRRESRGRRRAAWRGEVRPSVRRFGPVPGHSEDCEHRASWQRLCKAAAARTALARHTTRSWGPQRRRQ